MNWSAVSALSKRFFRQNVRKKRFLILLAMPMVGPILAGIAYFAILFFSTSTVAIVCPRELETVAIQIEDALSQEVKGEQIFSFEPYTILVNDEKEAADTESSLKKEVSSNNVLGYIIVSSREGVLSVKTYPTSSIRDTLKDLKKRVLAVTPLLRKDGYERSKKVDISSQIGPLLDTEEKMSKENLRVVGGQFLVIISLICLSILDTNVFHAVLKERVLHCLETLMTVITPKELCWGLCVGNIKVFLLLFSWYMLLGSSMFLMVGVISLQYILSVILFAIGGCVLSCLLSSSDALIFGNLENPKQTLGIYMPVKFVLLTGCFYSLSAPDSNIAIILGLFPVTSPYVAPFRFEYGDSSSLLEYSIALLILIISSWIVYRFRLLRIRTEQIIYPKPKK